jgi:hypothetical protein
MGVIFNSVGINGAAAGWRGSNRNSLGYLQSSYLFRGGTSGAVARRILRMRGWGTACTRILTSLLKHLEPHIAQNRWLSGRKIGEASCLTEASYNSCALQIGERLVNSDN